MQPGASLNGLIRKGMVMKRYILTFLIITSLTASRGFGQCIDIGPAMAAICQGGTSGPLGATLVGDATNPVWSDGGIGGTFNPTANELNATWTPPGTYNGTATLTLTVSGGTCLPKSEFKTITVEVDPYITTEPSSPAAICAGGTTSAITLTATGGTPALLYQWQYYNGSTWNDVSNGTPSGSTYTGSTSTSFTVSGITAAGTYDYRCVVSASGSGCGTATSTTVTVTVESDPYITSEPTSPAAICAGGTTSAMTISASGGTPSLTYQWQYFNGSTWNNAVNGTPAGSTYTGATGTSFIVSGISSSGSYDYRCLVSSGGNGCGTATSNTVTVTVAADPAVSVQPSSPAAICAGGTTSAITLTATGGTPALLYQWQYYNGSTWNSVVDGTPAGAVYTGSTGTSFTVSGISSSGSYDYRCFVSAGGSGCGTATSNTVTVTVAADPAISVQPSNPSDICSGGTTNAITLTATGGTPALLYQWQYYNGSTWNSVSNGTPSGSTYTGSTSASFTVSGITAAGTYDYRCIVSASGSGCGIATSNTVTVTVYPLPTLSGASQDAAVCSGSPALINLTGLLPSTISTIHYSIAGVVQTPVTNVSSEGTGTASFSTVILTPDNNGKVLTITGITTTSPSPNCYQAFTITTILIVNTATVPVITGNFSPCVNSTGNVYTTDAGMTNYIWNVSAGGTVTAGGGTTNNSVTVTWNTTGSQSVSVNYTNSNGCTAASPTLKSVDVKPLPTPAISGILPVCIHSGGHTYTTEQDMTSYTWSVSAGNTITSGGTGNMIIVQWDNSTASSVSVNYTDANGCRALAPTTSPVTVNSLPVPDLSGASSACAGSTGNLYSTDAGMSNYVWTVSSGGTITSGGGSANSSVTVTWDTPGARKVTVNYTVPATGCTASAAKELPVTVNSLPVPSITGPASPNLNTAGNVYTTEALMSGYIWNISAGGTITGGDGTNSISVTWNTSGAQNVSVNYTNSNSCTAVSPTVYNVTVNSLPVASGITIIGNARSGMTLNASYIYSDADGDPEGTSQYQWYTGTSSGGAGAAPIPSATSTSYKLTDSELTKYIGFSVTPVALSGSTPGALASTVTWAGPVINDPPVATIQPITGSLNVNGLLTGRYVYSDTEGDIESGTLYQWYSSVSAAGPYTPIAGETGIAHVITNNEQGKYFKIYITPVAASGTTTGTQVQSTAYGPANSQPAASNVQIISGIAAVGSTLEGDYDFSDADPADSEGTSTFRWLRNGTISVSGAMAKTYLVTPEDEGYKLSFEVTPVSLTGFPDTGTPVQSALTDVVADTSTLKPVASQVCVEGIRAAGQILRGKYYYDFYKSEGISTYQWYRNGIPIPGAAGIQYTLQQAADIDSNADITFEVTPRSSNIPEKVGVPVMSNPLARIIMPKDQYSVSENDVTLSANVLGGVFSGTGVTGNIFSPKRAGSDGSPYTISYLMNIVNIAHNCSQQASRLVYVNPNVSSFEGLDPVYCHDGGPDMITVTGVPAGSTIIGFTLTDSDGIVSQSGTSVTIDPGRMRPGVDFDILFFSYSFEGTFYQISKSLTIDSVGTEIRVINLESTYCQGDPRKYISIEGIYPLGGTASWTGDILSDTRTGSAFADPSLGAPGVKYPVSYRYRSPLGCYSKILNDTVTINPLPDASFALNPTYNIDGGSVQLVPVQPGGSFSGNGVSGERMFPEIAGLGEHEIKYTITDANNCSAGLGKKTTIRKAQGSFTGIPSVICYSDTTYRVNVTGLPAGVTVTGFTNTKNTLSYTMGFTYGDYNVPAAGEGFDTLRFAYKWDGVDYSISRSLIIDSLGQVTIKNLTPDNLICDNMAPFELFPSITGGTFTGPVSGSYLDPTKGVGPAIVTYTYTNFKTGCSISTSIPVTIYPAPKVAFAPADVCIENVSDTTFFNNSTTSSDTVQTWLWEFSDAGGTKFSNKKDAGYLYTTGGLQKIALTATTVNGCISVKESTFNLGVRPDADFYWRSDCMHPGDSLILLDNTKSSSPISSRSWRLYNGAEFSTAEKEARYPKTDTGYLKIQYIVRTTYANCIDTVVKNIFIKPAITIPPDGYFENFGTGNGGWIKGETAGTSWSFGTPAWNNVNVEASGGKSWYTSFPHMDNKTESSSIISPCFNFTETVRPLIKLSMMKRFTRDRDGASLQYRVGDSDSWQSVGALDDGIFWYNSPVIRGEPGGNQIGWTTRGDPDTKWVESIHTLDDLVGKSDVVFRLAYGSDGTSREYEGIALDDIWLGERSRKVLVEHFTNITSKESSDANMIVNEVVNNRRSDIINIQYHTNFPGSDPYYSINQGDASARILFYGLTRVPYTFIDGGTQKDYAYMYAYTNVAARIDSNVVTKRSLIPSQFDLALTTEVNAGNLVITGAVTALENINADNMALFIAVIEKKNSQYTGPLGEKEFHNVFRKFIPDAGGIILKNRWTKGDILVLGEHVWTIKNIPDSSDIEVIAFIQNTITKEVYQASSVSHQQIIVGIEDIPGASESMFVLYPNPAVNKLTVRFKEPLSYETDIRIFDIRGIAVREYKTGRGITDFTIDNLDLKGGIYFVRVSAKGIDLGYRKLVVR